MGFRGVDYLLIDSQFSEQELLVRQTARRFVDERVLPLLRDSFREGRFPRELVPEMADLGASLERAFITANKNAIPYDPEKPTITSGVRLGSPAATTRGFGTDEFREIGLMINEVLEALGRSNDGTNAAAEAAVGARVKAMCARFPIYAGR